MELYVTKHAEKRLVERCGLNKKSMLRMAEKVFDNGKKINETKGALNRWLVEKYNNNEGADNIRLYGDNAWIFSGNYLLTVLHVPNKLLHRSYEQNVVSFV